MTEIKRVSELIPDHKGLDVCTDINGMIQILQWQCEGVLKKDIKRGVFSDDQLFVKKASAFIELAHEEKANLVLTPEYSFPYSVIDEIIANRSKWPKPGSLWCICPQGESRCNFEKKLYDWENINGVEVIKYALENGRLGYSEFVSSLLYIFRHNGNLCLLPQFKTGPMSDKWNEFEKNGLCRGSVVFLFDLSGNNQAHNVFLSLICSDVAYQIENIIKGKINREHVILFNPQLNPNPRHSVFIEFRNEFYNTSGYEEVKIITLNWAKGTKIYSNNENDHVDEFNIPFSAFYRKERPITKELKEIQNKNFYNGTSFALNTVNHSEIWFSFPHEHCKSIHISKYVRDVSCAMGKSEEPITCGCFVYSDSLNKWIKDIKPCRNELAALFIKNYINKDNYNFPLRVCCCHENSFTPNECKTKSFCKMCKADFFFSLCFADIENVDNENSEYFADGNEVVKRMVVGSDEESDSERYIKAANFNTLICLLESKDYPIELQYLKNNHKFCISDNYPDYGKERYNIVTEKEVEFNGIKNKNLHARVVILPRIYKEEHINKIYKKIAENLDERFRNQILIFYNCINGEYRIFDKHLTQKEVEDGNFAKRISSIKNITGDSINEY